MRALLQNIRFYIIVSGIALSLIIFFFLRSTLHGTQLQIIRLEQWYGFLSVIYLYVALVSGPFCYRFSSFPFTEQFLKARRAIGVMSFYFALLHFLISFFGELDGLRGINFLGTNFLIAVLLGFAALVILFFLTITSFDYAVKKMKFRNWKLLHRFVYLAGILLLIHMLLIGTHYGVLSDSIPQITFIALAFLLFLEAPRLDSFIQQYIALPDVGIPTLVLTVALSIVYVTVVFPLFSNTSPLSFDVHAGHRALAQQAQQTQQFAVDVSKLPGLDGDKNKRFTVGMSTDPQNPLPNQPVTIHFRVFDATSGNPVTYYKFIYARQVHMIVVNSSLTYFQHIHPLQESNGFVISTQFPVNDMYHIYIEFQPYGGIEQQVAFTLPVGDQSAVATSTESPDKDGKNKTFGSYTVLLNTHGDLSASALSFGSQEISFTISNALTKAPITTLKPYLASFGHLTMINESTYDFIHVHPYSLAIPPPNATGGPTVDFLPIGIYGPFKPGVYRAFAEFNPDGKVFTADFTIKIN